MPVTRFDITLTIKIAAVGDLGGRDPALRSRRMRSDGRRAGPSLAGRGGLQKLSC